MSAAPLNAAACGERIEQLLEASAAAGPVARERAEELVRLVVDLYGAGLERLLELAFSAGALTPELLAALAEDELVSSLLIVHGLHPYGVADRVARALAEVPDVTLLEVDEGVARVAVRSGCGSSAPSAQDVEEAILAVAPEVLRVEVVAPAAAQAVIPADALTVRLRA